uniref:Large ribosomal subunit protein uL4c n=1 Tax=Mastocarpus papillatus TaxID=31436 RepID=A0A342RZH8_9FLOR|nr:50S ribosomal protein L4 [Mastocarpus papillatus]AOL58124.1 50S ribosomal protein L4 [Mastocarpus papillatus]
MIIEQKLTYSVLTEEDSETYLKEIKLRINEDKGMYIIHRALNKQLNNNRQGNANTKSRGEIRGGGRKPWKQKGSGKARAGSIRSPLWEGGGVIFGPKRKNYNIKINKKEKQLALRTLLHNKFKQTYLVSNIITTNINKPNTKAVLKTISNLSINLNKKTKILFIVVNKNINLRLSIRNLPNVELITADQLHIIALLKANKIIITIDALNKIKEVYNA